MKKLFSVFVLCAVLFACKKSDKKSIYFASPIAGATLSSGDDIFLKTDAEPESFDSIQYFIDTVFIDSRKDTSTVKASTSGFSFGGVLVTAKVFSAGVSTDVTTNIQLFPASVPLQYSFTLVNTYPHDTSSYTQGLEYHGGVLYESDGLVGESSLRKVDVNTGKVLKIVDIPAPYFAEGITLIGNKIVMLTWKNRIGFEFDKNTFEKNSEFPYNASPEGWGLAFNGKQIISTDGSNNIYYLNKDTYQKEGQMGVYDNNGPVQYLNELEIIDGKIYANIYQTDIIAVIDPVSGGVEAYINLSELYPTDARNEFADVLNGIAWDAGGRRLFVTGKKWDKLFQIKINKGEL